MGRKLTRRELQLLWLIAHGAQTHQMARLLCISEHTIRNQIADLLGKLNAQTRAEALFVALKDGLFEIRD